MYYSFIFHVLETGNPHAIITDYRGGRDVIWNFRDISIK